MQDENVRQTHADSHNATETLEMSKLSEQLQENEQEIDRPTEEGKAAAYFALDHSTIRENHVYDVIS